MTDDASASTIHLQLIDVGHEGVRFFLTHFASKLNILQDQYRAVRSILYDEDVRQSWNGRREKEEWKTYEPRSVTVVVHDMAGIAYTTGRLIDDEHKEIHLSAEYIAKLTKLRRMGKAEGPPTRTQHMPIPTASVGPTPEHRLTGKGTIVSTDDAPCMAFIESEIKGVLVHEMVHTMQFNGKGTCPGGLIEGIADWVRLRAGLSPPHWKPDEIGDDKRWDDGYAVTAYFLVWLEGKLHCPHLVPTLNQTLAHHQWHDGRAMDLAVGRIVDIEALFHEYRQQHQTETGRCA